jgi:predicted amidohydrolase YtcJ
MVDTLYRNAKVVTVDPDFAVAEAFAVTGDRFAAVGGDAELDALRGPATRVVDLGGRTVVPGFVDAHAHAVHRALAGSAEPSLAGAGSVAEIARRVAAAAATTTPGAWIAGTPVGEAPDYFDLPGGFTEGRWPERTDLDAAAPTTRCNSTAARWPLSASTATPPTPTGYASSATPPATPPAWYTACTSTTGGHRCSAA